MVDIGISFVLFERRHQKNIPPASNNKARTPAPAPIPAFAAILRPDELGMDSVAVEVTAGGCVVVVAGTEVVEDKVEVVLDTTELVVVVEVLLDLITKPRLES
jgi:hypothetical protein